MKKHAPIVVLVLSLTLTAAAGRDWPNWRGPFHNGSTDETNLPTTWSTTENVAWVTPLPGRAYSTPIVVNGRIFLSSTVAENDDLLGMCIEERTGKVLWKVKLSIGNRATPGYNQSSPSPVTDGKVVCFLFGSGALAGLDFSGKVLWQRSLVQEYGPLGIKWGYASSPLMYKGKLYVVNLRNTEGYFKPGRNLDSYLLCADPATGKNIFRHVRNTTTSGEDRETYATPMPLEVGGRTEIVLVGGDYVTGHDADTGRETWRWCYNPPHRGEWRRVVPSPVIGGGLIFMMRPQQQGMYALKTGLKGKVPDRGYVWRYPQSDDLLRLKVTPDVCTPLLYKGRLYVLHEQRKTLSCMDPQTGKVKWIKSLGARVFYRGSATGADDKIYCWDVRGRVVVLAAGDQFKLLATVEMGEKFNLSTIVAANGHLYIRTMRNLYCIGAKKWPAPRP